MKLYSLIITGLFVIESFFFVQPVSGQSPIEEEPGFNPEIFQESDLVVEDPVFDATQSAQEATASALVKRVVEKKPNITEPEPEIKGKLEMLLEMNPPGPLSPFNFIRHAIRNAVAQGVPANTIVLILLFPLVSTVVVISRHVIGLKSFGIFTPALLSVAFLATGLLTGISLFIIIIGAASLARMLLRRFRIQYLPRMAIFMWFISMAIFSALLISPSLRQEELITLGIFPILILILLAESYIDVQITRTFSQSLVITAETLVIAVLCYLLMKMEILQNYMLLNPESFTASLLLLIILVDRYSGLRLLEIWRFRKIIWK